MTALSITLGVVAVTLFLLLLSLGAPYRPSSHSLYRSSFHWSAKAAIIIICGLFYLALWHALPRLQGRPLDGPPPAEFELVSQLVIQPDKRGGQGAIYLWVIDLTQARRPAPRAYKLPYSEELHENIVRATADGKTQKGARVKQASGAAGTKPSERIQFQPMPTPRLPPKD